jgi:hypothetical protein
MNTIVIVCVLLFSGSAFGQLSQQVASPVTQQINALMSDYTDTLVTPTNGTDGVIVSSMKSLQSEKVAKLWTFIAASAIGKCFNDHREVTVREIWFADITGMKARPARYSVLPPSDAKYVQAQVYVGAMSIEDGQAKV